MTDIMVKQMMLAFAAFELISTTLGLHVCDEQIGRNGYESSVVVSDGDTKVTLKFSNPSHSVTDIQEARAQYESKSAEYVSIRETARERMASVLNRSSLGSDITIIHNTFIYVRKATLGVVEDLCGPFKYSGSTRTETFGSRIMSMDGGVSRVCSYLNRKLGVVIPESAKQHYITMATMPDLTPEQREDLIKQGIRSLLTVCAEQINANSAGHQYSTYLVLKMFGIVPLPGVEMFSEKTNRDNYFRNSSVDSLLKLLEITNVIAEVPQDSCSLKIKTDDGMVIGGLRFRVDYTPQGKLMVKSYTEAGKFLSDYMNQNGETNEFD